MVLQNLAWFALLLGSLVVVHELGHFIAAKLCGVKVLKFSVGFGPKLLAFTRGETEYRLSVLPLGGYVKMAGDLPGEELAPEEAHRGFLAQSPWRRAFIGFAGPAFNLIFPILIYFTVFAGYPQASTRVLSLTPGLPPAEAGLRLGDRIVAVNGHHVESYSSLKWMVEDRSWDDLHFTIERNGTTQELHLASGRTLNGDPIRTVREGFLLGFSPAPDVPILGVPAGSAAAVAGLQTFDRVIAVDGKPVGDTLALTEALKKDAASGEAKLDVARFTPANLPSVEVQSFQHVTATVKLVPGQTGLAALGADREDLYIGGVTPGSAAKKAGLQRGDRLVQVNGQNIPAFAEFLLTLEQFGTKPFELTYQRGAERKTATLQRAPLDRQGDLGQMEKRLVVGIEGLTGYIGDIEGVDKVRLSARASLVDSVHQLELVTARIAGALGMLITGRVSLDNLGGPIALYQIAAKSSQEGFDAYLDWMGIISVNLGLVNLLPIPVLDGFLLLSAFWEGIRRRPIPARSREIANMIGLVLLVLLMVRVLFNDVTHWVL